MKEAKKHIQNWKDIHIADIPKLYEIGGKRLKRMMLFGKVSYKHLTGG